MLPPGALTVVTMVVGSRTYLLAFAGFRQESLHRCLTLERQEEAQPMGRVTSPGRARNQEAWRPTQPRGRDGESPGSPRLLSQPLGQL